MVQGWVPASRVSRQETTGLQFCHQWQQPERCGVPQRETQTMATPICSGAVLDSGGGPGVLLKAAGRLVAQARLGIQAIEALADGPQFIKD
jgi:hypothetical protein